MITIVNSAPFPFERLVVEELAEPLAKRGFRVKPTFHLYKNQEVGFVRQREGHEEQIVLQRAIYSDEYRQHPLEEDEVEKDPINFGDDVHGANLRWVSRHQLSVDFIVDGATNWLQRDGKAGVGEDYWWRFTDEADLRRLLRELLPMILAAGQETFDDVPLRKPTAA